MKVRRSTKTIKVQIFYNGEIFTEYFSYKPSKGNRRNDQLYAEYIQAIIEQFVTIHCEKGKMFEVREFIKVFDIRVEPDAPLFTRRAHRILELAKRESLREISQYEELEKVLNEILVLNSR